MKVVAFNCSSRKDGNTAILLNVVLDEIKKEGIGTELVQLAGTPIAGCIACYRCFKNRNGRCAVDKDPLNSVLDKMKASEGILIGSPTYFSDVSATAKALIERCGFVSRANDYLLKRKVGAGVIAVRRAGAVSALNSINLFLSYMQMIIPGTSYWNLGIGRDPGDVKNDAEGIQTMSDLGKNMAWVMKKIL